MTGARKIGTHYTIRFKEWNRVAEISFDRLYSCDVCMSCLLEMSVRTVEMGCIQGRSQPFERDDAILKFAELVTYNSLEN